MQRRRQGTRHNPRIRRHYFISCCNRDGLVKKANAEHQECSAYYRLNLNGGEVVLAFTLPLAVTSLKLINEQYAVAVPMWI